MRLALAAVLSLFVLPVQAEEITVFAAASLKTAMDQIAADWQEQTGDMVLVSYGGSSALGRQIVQGAPADLFISASPAWMDEVEAAGLVQPGSRRDLLGNTLVLIASGEADPLTAVPADPVAMLDGGKLAMALVDAVPAGQYGKQALQSLGVWDAMEPHVAQADNVRAALALVATGAAPYGVTYASDAIAEPRVTAVYTFPDGSHDPITYPAALTTDAAPAAAAFHDALSGPEAAAIFRANGFIPLT
ncbi:molybdate ABC transporter substrate-binding protein [Paracoccus tegillarcae]|uniref:Molybdate-binding protein ModA n=1 Tax=Paracoccus tegillarcae TaxID=1529068 RepID=A0A2K9EZ00_9RHOB|nr:molybdate ABC transporter substrate-binding protein [Paracoccus tegillarcae]AUH33332.1 molybdate ABC transporter substrate-binding protein [Paracoccus tegillarcae]